MYFGWSYKSVVMHQWQDYQTKASVIVIMNRNILWNPVITTLDVGYSIVLNVFVLLGQTVNGAMFLASTEHSHPPSLSQGY